MMELLKEYEPISSVSFAAENICARNADRFMLDVKLYTFSRT